MNRLLIVDDEPIIVNGLVDFFSQQDQRLLEVYGAHSAEEALAILKQNRMDVVITDIGMPDMDGLELQKRINRHWPRCKVIFLTGYNDFGYVQEAMRHQGFDYVLKAEGDEAILKSFEKALMQMEEEIRKEEMIALADKQLRLALPSLQKELLQQLLQGNPHALTRLPEHFKMLQFPLHPDQPVMMVLVRVDNFKQDYGIYDCSLLIYSIQNVAQEYLHVSVAMASVELDRSRMMWFIQPHAVESADSDSWGESRCFVKGSLELIQQTCKELLGTPLSFIMRDSPVLWSEVAGVYEEYMRMMSRGLGMGTEFLWTYQGELDMPTELARLPFHSGQLKNQLDLLKLNLQNGHKEAFDSVLSEVLLEGARHAAGSPIQQEIYYSLVPLFLSHMNRHFPDELIHRADLSKLTIMGAHGSWREAMDFFRELSKVIFIESKAEMEQEENVVVSRIQKYVQDHLDGDLSLIRIGDFVGHNSKYLSRLYKKITGEDLSNYISRTKLDRAKLMLKETNMKIYEVSSAVGFLSEPYFYRFFRKATGMTPLEYREINKVVKR